MNAIRYLILSAVLSSVMAVDGQNVISVREGWFDDDVASSMTVTNGASLDISSLSPGIHGLTVRVKDSNGMWSCPTTRYFVVPTVPKKATTIEKREAWLDGNVSGKLVLLGGTSIIDLGELAPGLHSLTVRVQDDNGVWSNGVTQHFVVPTVPKKATAIAKSEAWIDGDVATKQTLTGTSSVIDLGEMSPGLHTLTVRVQDDNGVWSNAVTQYFVVPTVPKKATAIEKREAWIDGNANDKIIMLGAESLIDLGELPSGLHSLTVRVMDDNGVWSNAVTQYFVVPTVPKKATAIKRHEAWFDGDVSQRFVLDPQNPWLDLTGFKAGAHSITVRVQDDNNVWSNPVTQHFIVPTDATYDEIKLVSCVYWFDDNYLDAETQPIEGNQGVVTIKINKLDGGSHTISWSVCDNKGVWSDVVTEPFEANYFGDINNDLIVDVTDLAAVINAVLGKDDPNIVNSPDLNADGVIDVSDVAIEINYILGRRDL